METRGARGRGVLGQPSPPSSSPNGGGNPVLREGVVLLVSAGLCISLQLLATRGDAWGGVSEREGSPWGRKPDCPDWHRHPGCTLPAPPNAFLRWLPGGGCSGGLSEVCALSPAPRGHLGALGQRSQGSREEPQPASLAMGNR